MVFFFLAFLHWVIKVLVHIKGQSLHQQKLLFPTENTAPETPPQ